MVLCADGRHLSLRGAERRHVVAAEGGVDVHEHAVRLVRFRAGRRHRVAPHCEQLVDGLLASRQVPASFEGGHAFRGIRHHHLLGPDGEDTVVRFGRDQNMREIEGGRGRSAGILHVDDRRVAEAGTVKRGLPANPMLTVERPLSGVREDDRLGLFRLGAGVGKRFGGRSGRKRPDFASRENGRTASFRRRR